MGHATASRDILAYELGLEFLARLDGRITEAVLGEPATPLVSATDMAAVYRQLLESAKSPHMKYTVIGDVDRLREVLCGFNPTAIVAKYARQDDLLLDQIILDARPSGQVRRTPQSIWPQFCRTALSGAAFLSRFASVADFQNWAASFDSDDTQRLALSTLLAKEIQGVGPAVACDFLKELGFHSFSKPDTHVTRILKGLRLCESDSVCCVFEAVARIARSNSRSPYVVDKLFWVIGSGWVDGLGISIGRQADSFIAFAVPRMAGR